MSKRLDALIKGANDSGFTIDYLEALTSGLSLSAAQGKSAINGDPLRS